MTQIRVLFVHNRYAKVSGEEVMIGKITDLLRAHGHVVDTFFADSAEIQGLRHKVGAFFSGCYSLSSRRALRQRIAEFRPDIIQIQNLYPLISPAVLPVAKEAGVPVVMRLSNYRLMCPNGLFLSHGQVCQKCLGGREYWCTLRNCEDDFVKSLGYTVRNWIARRLRYYLDNVDVYYAQTEFQRRTHIEAGFSAERVHVIPNIVAVNGLAAASGPGDYVGFSGRVSAEKGFQTFLDAARRCPDVPFRVAGYAAPSWKDAGQPPNLEFVGQLSGAALEDFYAHCRFLVLPSLWFEGFPNVAIEAMSHGRPVVASRIGGLPEVVEEGVTGRLFPPGDAEGLAVVIRELWPDEAQLRRLGLAGMEKVRRSYGPEVHYEKLVGLYRAQIDSTSEPEGLARRAA